jgi:hypothetical protein
MDVGKNGAIFLTKPLYVVERGLWESLHNARPRNLRGFGTVTPELFEMLDPEWMRVIDLVGAMSRAVGVHARRRDSNRTQL